MLPLVVCENVRLLPAVLPLDTKSTTAPLLDPGVGVLVGMLVDVAGGVCVAVGVGVLDAPGGGVLVGVLVAVGSGVLVGVLVGAGVDVGPEPEAGRIDTAPNAQ